MSSCLAKESHLKGQMLGSETRDFLEVAQQLQFPPELFMFCPEDGGGVQNMSWVVTHSDQQLLWGHSWATLCLVLSPQPWVSLS